MNLDSLHLTTLFLVAVLAAGIAGRIIADRRRKRFPWVLYFPGDARRCLGEAFICVVSIGRGSVGVRTIVSWLIYGYRARIPIGAIARVDRTYWHDVAAKFKGAGLDPGPRKFDESLLARRYLNCCVVRQEDAVHLVEDVLVFMGRLQPWDHDSLMLGQAMARDFCDEMSARGVPVGMLIDKAPGESRDPGAVEDD